MIKTLFRVPTTHCWPLHEQQCIWFAKLIETWSIILAVFAITHVYAMDNFRPMAERPVQDPRILISLTRDKVFPQDLAFRPTSMEDRHYAMILDDIMQSKFVCRHATRYSFRCFNLGPYFYPELFLERQVYICDERSLVLAIL